MNTDVLTSIFTQYFHKFACLNHIMFVSRVSKLKMGIEFLIPLGYNK